MAAASSRGRSIADDKIELNVVPVERKRFDDLRTKGDSDRNGARGAMSKKAIEKAGAASDPRPCTRESDTGHEDKVDRRENRNIVLTARGWQNRYDFAAAPTQVRNQWRNFLAEVLIPSLFTRRSGERAVPRFPKIRPGEFCITWIGHASFLIQTHDCNILVDPNWAKWLKVIKRLKQPGIELHHLPDIDLVLVTHAHFDQLDRRTLRRIASDQPIGVPVRVGTLVPDF